MSLGPSSFVLGHCILVVLLAWAYFRSFTVKRPPIGVFNLWDVALMLLGITLVPYLYLAVPFGFVAAFLGAGFLGILYVAWEPLMPTRWGCWLTTLLLTGGNLVAYRWCSRTLFFSVNNAVLMMAVIGVTNIWAQSGMRVRDTALLGALLGIYDFLATWQSGHMLELFNRLMGLPFAPMLVWPGYSPAGWVGIGLGDLLFAALFPLLMRKGYGKGSGTIALVVSILALAGPILAFAVGLIRQAFPMMIVLGPLMAAQYLIQRRRRGRERTTYQYLQAEPIRALSPPDPNHSRQMLDCHCPTGASDGH